MPPEAALEERKGLTAELFFFLGGGRHPEEMIACTLLLCNFWWFGVLLVFVCHCVLASLVQRPKIRCSGCRPRTATEGRRGVEAEA